MRALSAQGREVWDILKQNGVYYAKPELAREEGDYTEDIRHLNGQFPIWCYAYPNINYYTLYDGTVLDYLRQAMSLDRKNCWDTFHLYEIELNRSDTFMGISGNTDSCCRVFAKLTLDMVKAVYSIKDSNCDNPFYKTLTPVYTCSSDVITTTELDCEKADSYAKDNKDLFEVGGIGECLNCGEGTSFVYNGKHYCSLKCMWEHKQSFICKQNNTPKDVAKSLYDSLLDCNFKHGFYIPNSHDKGDVFMSAVMKMSKEV